MFSHFIIQIIQNKSVCILTPISPTMTPPPRSSCSTTCGVTPGPATTRCAPSGARANLPYDFMSKVPSPIVTMPGAATPASGGPATPAAASNPAPLPTLTQVACVPECPSSELMPVCDHPNAITTCSCDFSLHRMFPKRVLH
jgi:hypothetical protein